MVFHIGITVLEGTLMKKRLIALLLVFVLLIPAGMASAAGWYRVNTTSLKVRYLPSESSRVIGSYRKDYAAKILSSSDGWSYVQFSNGFKGYVQTKYLSKGSSYSAWITSDGTSLRRGPDGGFAATAKLAKGRKVTVLSHGARYDYVSAGELGSGYVVNSLLSKSKVKASGSASTSTAVSGGNYDAWIMHSRKVNLRKSASTNAPIVASYNPGTKVHVVTHGATWDKVTVGSNTGYMMTQFLTTSEPAQNPSTPTPTPKSSYTAYVVSPNKKPVNVRRGAGKGYGVAFSVSYGTAVTVLEHNANWDYIQHGTRKGYIQNNFLQTSKPADVGSNTPVPNVTATPFQQYTAKIYAANGKSVNVHKGMGDSYSNICRLEVNTTVTVIEHVGRWAHIKLSDGRKGWVHREFLKK